MTKKSIKIFIILIIFLSIFNKSKATDSLDTMETNDIQIEEIMFDEKNKMMTLGEEATLNTIFKPDNVLEKNLMFFTSNSRIVSIDSTGKIKAVGIGNAVVSAVSSNEKVANCKIKVEEDVKNITLNKTKVTLHLEQSTELTASIYPSNSRNNKVTFTSDDENIATVDENGKITAINEGTTYVIAKTINGKIAKCEVTVTKKSPLTAEQAGQIIANCAIELYKNHRSEFVYDNDDGIFEYAYAGKKRSGYAHGTANKDPGPQFYYTNKYAVQCSNYTNVVVHWSLGLDDQTKHKYWTNFYRGEGGFFKKVEGIPKTINKKTALQLLKPGDLIEYDGHVALYVGTYIGTNNKVHEGYISEAVNWYTPKPENWTIHIRTIDVWDTRNVRAVFRITEETAASIDINTINPAYLNGIDVSQIGPPQNNQNENPDSGIDEPQPADSGIIEPQPADSVRFDQSKSIMTTVKNYKLSSGKVVNFWLYTPEVITDDMPFIMFLHGSGENEVPVDKLKSKIALVKNLYEKKIGVNAIIVIPATKGGSDMIENIKGITELFTGGKYIDSSNRRIVANKNKMGIIGFSAGSDTLLGYGKCADYCAPRFKTYIFISGFTSNHAKDYKDANGIRAFYGSNDKVINNNGPKNQMPNVVNIIKKAGGKASNNTEIIKFGEAHGGMVGRVFKDNTYLQWMIDNM